jgi:hypothetical protein
MKRRRVDWDFPYEPVSAAQRDEGAEALDVVVATSGSIDRTVLQRCLRAFTDLHVETLVDRAPLHWTRVRSRTPASRLDVAALLSRAGVATRYVAATRRASMELAPPLDFEGAQRATARDWATSPAPSRDDREGLRAGTDPSEPSEDGGRWFLGANGVRVERAVCGTGRGTRLAVVDDDAADLDRLELERLVLVGVSHAPAASGHGALMVGWAVGARRADETPFVGVAPDASVRLYCIPKPGEDLVSLPLAIVRAALDGADVIVCATYVEGTTSPMLDDAFEVAVHLGRGGRGTPIVLPTGRETSSPGDSLHASLSLALGDPASDPRTHCVAPSGRSGGWFLWRDARGKLRPFANRGPAVRWLAPGDDLAYPFAARARLFHAESSGASAVAAGVLALVLGRNPSLGLGEIHALLARTAHEPDPVSASDALLADPADVLPAGRDRDGHDAKCGYGLLNATRACAAASDPVALVLTAMGEDGVADAWCLRRERPYSQALAEWAVGALLARQDLEHATRSIARHARLVAIAPARATAHAPGALARQLGLVVRELMRSAPAALRGELGRALDGLRRASSDGGPFGAMLEQTATSLFEELWKQAPRGA